MSFTNSSIRVLNKMFSSNPTRFAAATAVIGATVRTVGTGLNDISSGGTYTALVDHVYTVKISTAAGTDKFQFKTDSGAYGAEVSLTGSAQNLANGVQITFVATTGHTLNDTWTITVTAGVAITCATLANVQFNTAGSGGTLTIYNGTNSSGAVLYNNASIAVTTSPLSFGYNVSSSVYVALYASSSYPDVVVGTN